jgi:hypothetical protein
MITIEKFLSEEEIVFCMGVLAKYENHSSIRALVPVKELKLLSTKIKYYMQNYFSAGCNLESEDGNFSFMRYPVGSWLPPHTDSDGFRTDYKKTSKLVNMSFRKFYWRSICS